MPHIETHKLIAVVIYIAIVIFEWISGGKDKAIACAVVLGLFLLLIIFSGIFAFLGSFGFMESFASDFSDGLSHSTVAILGWVIFLIACAFFVFNWSLN